MSTVRHSAQTIRQDLTDLLQQAERPLSFKEISSALGLSARELQEHMEHIQKSQKKLQGRIQMVPAKCKKCGFGFPKREKTSRPSKCPLCRGQYIEPPAFFWQDI